MAGGSYISWLFTCDREYVTFTAFTLRADEILDFYKIMTDILVGPKYKVHANLTDGTVRVNYYFDDIIDEEECGLWLFAKSCCRAMTYVITARDDTLAVPSVAVQYDFALRWPKWTLESSSSEDYSESDVEHNFNEISYLAFRQLEISLVREMGLWCEAKRSAKELSMKE